MSIFLNRLKAVKESLVLTVKMAALPDESISSAIDDEVRKQRYTRGTLARMSEFEHGSHWNRWSK